VLTLLGSGAGATLLAACLPQALSSGSPASTASASASASASSGTAVPSCVIVPELTEGPYYVDGPMERSDIRTDPSGGAARDGVPLALSFAVARVNGSDCTPYEGAVVDLWHCDALGEYSGRAVHMHFKIRTNPASNNGTELTSQLFFDDELSAEIFTTREPYSEKGTQDVTNDRDNIFAESNGQLTLSLSPDGDGYSATFGVGVQTS